MGADVRLDPAGFDIGIRDSWKDAIAEVEAAGGTPYAIPAGASEHPLGGLGFANWAFEVAEQEKALGIRFDTIVVCTVTGSTHAGMIAGFAALEDLTGVRAGCSASTPRATLEKTRDQVARIARHTAALIELGRDLRDDEITVLEGWAGELYGIPVESTIEAIRLAGRLEAMIIDPVYEGKSHGRADRPRALGRDRPRLAPCSTPTSAGSRRSTPTTRSGPRRADDAHVGAAVAAWPSSIRGGPSPPARRCGWSGDTASGTLADHATVQAENPRDPNALHAVLRRGTIEALDAVYRPSWVRYDYDGTTTLLNLALANPDPVQRVALACRLIDDGVGADRWQPLHVLFGRNDHDFELEAPLVQRMLDEGADVNRVVRDKKRGTPLEYLAGMGKFSDRDLAPFYDALLAWPALDLLQTSSHDRAVLANLRKMAPIRAELVRRAEQVLHDRGIAVPPV